MLEFEVLIIIIIMTAIAAVIMFKPLVLATPFSQRAKTNSTNGNLTAEQGTQTDIVTERTEGGHHEDHTANTVVNKYLPGSRTTPGRNSDKNHISENANESLDHESVTKPVVTGGIPGPSEALNFFINNSGPGNFYAVVGTHGTLKYNEVVCSHDTIDQSPSKPTEALQLEDSTLSRNVENGVWALVAEVEAKRKPRAALRFAFFLTHCEQGVSMKLLGEGAAVLMEGLQATSDCCGILNLVKMLSNHSMIKVTLPTEVVSLDGLHLKMLLSMDGYTQDRREASELFCRMLLHILEIRRASVCALHREAAKLAEAFLTNSSNLPTLLEASLYLAVGKCLSNVGALKDAFNYIEEFILHYEQWLETASERQRRELKQMSADAYLVKGKLARRQGGYDSQGNSLKYLEKARHDQMDIDGCSSEADVRTKEAARIQVAICETLLFMGQYEEEKRILENPSLQSIVMRDTTYHQAQYWSNLGCAHSFIDDHPRAFALLLKALEANSKDISNYRTPLYLSLLARVQVFWVNDLPPNEHATKQLLNNAERHCQEAQCMLEKDHGNRHRFFAFNESCMARVMFAKVTTSLVPQQNDNFMSLAVLHAKKAFEVYLHVYNNVLDHSNIAQTLHLIGDICDFLCMDSFQDAFARCQPWLEEVYHKSYRNQGCKTPCNAVEYTRYFYESTCTVSKRCCLDHEHPTCSKIEKAFKFET